MPDLISQHLRITFLNPFHATDLSSHPLKTSKNLWFFDVFREYQKRSVAWNGLKSPYRDVRSSHWRCSIKKLFLKISQCSQENICVELSFLIKLQVIRPAALLKRDSNTNVSCEYCEIFRNTYFEEHLQTAAFEIFQEKVELKRFQENVSHEKYI